MKLTKESKNSDSAKLLQKVKLNSMSINWNVKYFQ